MHSILNKIADAIKKVLKNGMAENVNVFFAILEFLNIFPSNTGLELVASKKIYIYIDIYIQTVTIFLNGMTSLNKRFE